MSKYNKILGSIMGAAVGDAMGAATETRSAERIKEDFGGYVDKIITPPSDCFARGYDAGTVTDDFSLAYFTAKELVASKGNVDAEAAKRALSPGPPILSSSGLPAPPRKPPSRN